MGSLRLTIRFPIKIPTKKYSTQYPSNHNVEPKTKLMRRPKNITRKILLKDLYFDFNEVKASTKASYTILKHRPITPKRESSVSQTKKAYSPKVIKEQIYRTINTE